MRRRIPFSRLWQRLRNLPSRLRGRTLAEKAAQPLAESTERTKAVNGRVVKGLAEIQQKRQAILDALEKAGEMTENFDRANADIEGAIRAAKEQGWIIPDARRNLLEDINNRISGFERVLNLMRSEEHRALLEAQPRKLEMRNRQIPLIERCLKILESEKQEVESL